MSLTYCQFAPTHPLHQPYHDQEYGFPLDDDSRLFERLALEINQAGLSWETILRKQENFRRAFDGFDLERVAAYGPEDEQRLLADAGIVRNRLKVRAVIENARRIQTLQQEHGSWKAWLDRQPLRTHEEWTRLFKKTFLFTGGEIVNEFLMSTGYLPGAHEPTCPVYDRIVRLDPPWLSWQQTKSEPE